MVKRVAIVGGGVAGLASAYWLARAGYKVKVYERHREIGFNPDGVRCGEAHLVRKEEGITPPRSAVSKVVDGVLLHASRRKYLVSPKHGNRIVVLEKPRFLRFLADIADKEGAEIITGKRISSKRDIDCDYDVILDASGFSPVFKPPLDRRKCGVTYQETIENCSVYPKNVLEQYWLDDELGYLWIFPKNDRTRTVNLGVGWLIRRSLRNSVRKGESAYVSVKAFLERWKEEHGVEGDVLRKTSGIVPLGYQRPLILNDVVFVGDSGIGADELTGGGIIRALHNARILPHFLRSGNLNERDYFRMLASEPMFKPLPFFRIAITVSRAIPRTLLHRIIFKLTAKRLQSDLRSYNEQ